MKTANDYAGSCAEGELTDWRSLSSYKDIRTVTDENERTVNIEVKGNRVWIVEENSTINSSWTAWWETEITRIKVL